MFNFSLKAMKDLEGLVVDIVGSFVDPVDKVSITD